MEPGSILLRLLAAIGVSLLASLIVRALIPGMGRRGAGVWGGACAGLALGPVVLGSIAPGLHADWMVGGVAQAAQAARIEARLPMELAALRESGVSEIAAQEHERSERARADELRLAAEREQAWRRAAVGALAGSCALFAAMLSFGPTRVRRAPFLSGVVAGTLCGLAAAVAVRLALGTSIPQACAVGAVVAGGVLGQHGSPRTRSFGLGAMVVSAVGLAAFAERWTGLSLAVFALIGLAIQLLSGRSASSGRARALVEMILVPTAAALVVSSAGMDVSAGGIVLIAAACVLAGDSQLIANWLAVNLCESGACRSRPLSAWLIRFGRTGPSWQVLLLGLAVAGNALEPSSAAGSTLVYAVVGAAAVSEATRPAAMRAISRFRRAATDDAPRGD